MDVFHRNNLSIYLEGEKFKIHGNNPKEFADILSVTLGFNLLKIISPRLSSGCREIGPLERCASPSTSINSRTSSPTTSISPLKNLGLLI